MKGQLKASTPAEYIEQLEEPRKSEIAALDALIRKSAPKLKPVICMGMLGYGPYHYKYASGREGDASTIALASNASYISLYISGADGCGSIAEQHRAALPKASIGKCCVRFKRLSDLDPAALKALITAGAKAKPAGA